MLMLQAQVELHRGKVSKSSYSLAMTSPRCLCVSNRLLHVIFVPADMWVCRSRFKWLYLPRGDQFGLIRFDWSLLFPYWARPLKAPSVSVAPIKLSAWEKKKRERLSIRWFGGDLGIPMNLQAMLGIIHPHRQVVRRFPSIQCSILTHTHTHTHSRRTIPTSFWSSWASKQFSKSMEEIASSPSAQRSANKIHSAFTCRRRKKKEKMLSN